MAALRILGQLGKSLMKRSIAVIGANLKGNLGDFALLHATIADLRSAFPNHVLDVYAHGFLPVDEIRLAAFGTSSRLGFTLAGKTFAAGNGPKVLANLAKSIRLWPAIQAGIIKSLANRKYDEASRFSNYEAVFIVGGAHWSGMRVGISMFGTLEAIRRHNTVIQAYPFSIEAKVGSYNSRRSLRRYFSRLKAPLIVRDSISQSVLDRLGVPSTLGADSVFMLEKEARQLPANDANPRRIIVAATGRGIADIGPLVTHARQNGREIHLMTTCCTEDESAMRKVAAQFGIPYLAPLTWQDAIAEIKACSLLVTNRLHGLIFGCLSAAAVLPVTDRQKSLAFSSDSGIPFATSSIGSMTPGLIDDCLAKRSQIIAKLRCYASSMQQRAMSPLAVVETSIAPR